MSEFDSEAVKTAREVHAPVLGISDRVMTRDVVEELWAVKIGAWVWTVNDPGRACMLASWPVRGICTDDPGTVLRSVSPEWREDRRPSG